jgi:hypothetical protein
MSSAEGKILNDLLEEHTIKKLKPGVWFNDTLVNVGIEYVPIPPPSGLNVHAFEQGVLKKSYQARSLHPGSNTCIFFLLFTKGEGVSYTYEGLHSVPCSCGTIML